MRFNLEISFKDIWNYNNQPYAIILTAGNLKPFDILEKELHIKFDNKKEFDHIIDKSQCHFSIIKDTIFNETRKKFIFDFKH